MKAAVYTNYGSTDELQLQEIEKPTPKDNQVLIKVYATSINASDWEFLTGKPAYARIYGLFKPRNQILGSDIAGQIEAVGKDVKTFRPGDKVFGDILGYGGGFAEYVCAFEHQLVLKPASMTYEQAATIPQGGVIALQGIRDKLKDKPAGQKVLINGAGGSAGVFAIQFAKMYGAEVTGVDNVGKLDFMRSLGADHVIDYRQTDFAQTGQQYDLILDLVASRSIFDCKRALTPTGEYQLVGGSMSALFQTLIIGAMLSRRNGQRLGVLGIDTNQDNLNEINALFEAGKLTPAIDRRYPLREAAEALRFHAEGRGLGKVIIAVDRATEK